MVTQVLAFTGVSATGLAIISWLVWTSIRNFEKHPTKELDSQTNP